MAINLVSTNFLYSSTSISTFQRLRKQITGYFIIFLIALIWSKESITIQFQSFIVLKFYLYWIICNLFDARFLPLLLIESHLKMFYKILHSLHLNIRFLYQSFIHICRIFSEFCLGRIKYSSKNII